MTDIVYDFSTIDSLSGSIATFVAQMNEQLSEVDSAFTNLLAQGWSGATADAFHGCSVKWHSNANQMAATLQMLAQKVGNASVNMAQADQSAAARF